MANATGEPMEGSFECEVRWGQKSLLANHALGIRPVRGRGERKSCFALRGWSRKLGLRKCEGIRVHSPTDRRLTRACSSSSSHTNAKCVSINRMMQLTEHRSEIVVPPSILLIAVGFNKQHVRHKKMKRRSQRTFRSPRTKKKKPHSQIMSRYEKGSSEHPPRYCSHALITTIDGSATGQQSASRSSGRCCCC